MFSLTPENSLVKLPVGKYRVNHWTIERRDTNGDQWKLEGIKAGANGSFDVKNISESFVQVGEPFVAKLSITQVSDTDHSLVLNLKGQLDERIALTCNGFTPEQQHQVNIRNINGTYDQTFPFSYG